MNKKAAVGLVTVGFLLVVLVGGIATMDWQTEHDSPQPVPVEPGGEGKEVDTNSLGYVIFEKYGFVLIPLALLMFGAMVGGVVISREEVEE